ncbi:hypothetical protein [Sphingosinicella sp. BN140058]|uniref:hypothetical protein n=1 Tax=Sphingosinicella sp. BN140058 TaxID=1892855 RepID=UPI0013ED389B|nr:hypothetical protein [Sphingosinicella sp. BN140058]
MKETAATANPDQIMRGNTGNVGPKLCGRRVADAWFGKVSVGAGMNEAQVGPAPLSPG